MKKQGEGKEIISCRDVLWFLVFCGFAINYMLRLNLNLTIVAMVMARPKAAVETQCSSSTNQVWNNDTSKNYTDLTIEEHDTFNNVTTISTLISPNPEDITAEYRYAWSEYEQGLVLGGYYWLHWLSQLPGGLLARRYGTKFVYGWGNFLTALLGFLIPFATRYHLYALVFLRVLQGLVAGVVWPSMHDMTAKWIPPNERSRFVSAYLGSSIGAAITYPLCAAVINWFGWSAAFYVTSTLGVIWYGFWFFLVYDSPQEHPRISPEEKKYITDNLSSSMTDDQVAEIPWRSILTSIPVWITIAAHWGSGWGFLTLITQTPSYFNFIHGWNINATGMLSGAPHILRMIFSYLFSVLSDWLLHTGRMSITNVRKIATFICTGLQGICILALGFSGCHPTLAIIFMMAGTVTNGAISASTLANFVDLSPNYASVLLGFCNLIVICTGFISPAIVGILTNNNQTVGQWRLVFIIAAANSIVGSIIYQIFGTSKEQPWNHHGESKSQEMQKIEIKAVTPKCEENVDKKEEDKLL